MDHPDLLHSLPTEQRLAMAYAPAESRSLCLGLLAFDARLAAIVRTASEPVLGQIRLAWWREQVATEPESRRGGEPLLAELARWRGGEDALTGLIDAWEALLVSAALDCQATDAIAAARGQVWSKAAQLGGHGEHCAAAGQLGQAWGLADLAARLGAGPERSLVIEAAAASDWPALHLPRALRPLAVLYGLARRQRGRQPLLDGPLALLAAIRLGLIGY
jgi:phytoene synthase